MPWVWFDVNEVSVKKVEEVRVKERVCVWKIVLSWLLNKFNFNI